ncbi:putative membrane protein [Propionispora sp. 2/2-37]|uniref:MFS transporter n=1 Tax=Propionispora sp. 2/2-37 TaxID=1677858 RepID=UPI0006BB59F2|nr:MFS transporter [Propionispora sp. 2/2-37]CUH95122.1 putative membrane protein [Propionispora sp. 2/2-37]
MEVEKLWTKEFILSCLSNLFAFISMYYIMSTLPLLITEALAGDKEQVGYLFGIFSFAGVVTRPMAGYLLDTMKRKTIAWIAVACLFFVMLAYNWITSLSLLFFLRFIHGVCWGFSTTSLATIATDAVPFRKRGEGIGYYGLSMSIAMFIGPILGLEMLQRFNYSSMFYIGAGFAAVALLCLLGIKGWEVCPVSTQKHRGIIETKVLSYGLIVFFLSMLYSGILSFIVLFGKEIGLENSGVYFLANALTVIVSRPYAGKILDKKGPIGVMCVGFLTLFATFLCLFFAQGYLLFILSALFLGIGFGIIHSSSIALAINKVDASRRGVVNGTVLTAFDLGFGIGSVLLGVLANYAGLKIMYLTSGLMVLIPFSIFYVTHMLKNKEAEVINSN